MSITKKPEVAKTGCGAASSRGVIQRSEVELELLLTVDKSDPGGPSILWDVEPHYACSVCCCGAGLAAAEQLDGLLGRGGKT